MAYRTTLRLHAVGAVSLPVASTVNLAWHAMGFAAYLGATTTIGFDVETALVSCTPQLCPCCTYHARHSGLSVRGPTMSARQHNQPHSCTCLDVKLRQHPILTLHPARLPGCSGTCAVHLNYAPPSQDIAALHRTASLRNRRPAQQQKGHAGIIPI
jgi:hypothetical protein